MTDITNLREIYRLMDKYDVDLPFYDALNFATDVLASTNNLSLEDQVRMSPAVMTEINAGKKIHAIKELRLLTNCSLLEAKNAVEAVMNDQSISGLRKKLEGNW